MSANDRGIKHCRDGEMKLWLDRRVEKCRVVRIKRKKG